MASGRVDLYNRKTSSATIDDGKQKYETKNRKEWKEVETSAFTYRVGVVYFPMPELSFYGSISSYFNPVTTTYSPTVMYLDARVMSSILTRMGAKCSNRKKDILRKSVYVTP